jgi:hypothetical protein
MRSMRQLGDILLGVATIAAGGVFVAHGHDLPGLGLDLIGVVHARAAVDMPRGTPRRRQSWLRRRER